MTKKIRSDLIVVRSRIFIPSDRIRACEINLGCRNIFDNCAIKIKLHIRRKDGDFLHFLSALETKIDNLRQRIIDINVCTGILPVVYFETGKKPLQFR
jgi:hypothetical protein